MFESTVDASYIDYTPFVSHYFFAPMLGQILLDLLSMVLCISYISMKGRVYEYE
jgi:hypothetical protein